MSSGRNCDDEGAEVRVVAPEPKLKSSGLSLFRDRNKVGRRNIFYDEEISSIIDVLDDLCNCGKPNYRVIIWDRNRCRCRSRPVRIDREDVVAVSGGEDVVGRSRGAPRSVQMIVRMVVDGVNDQRLTSDMFLVRWMRLDEFPRLPGMVRGCVSAVAEAVALVRCRRLTPVNTPELGGRSRWLTPVNTLELGGRCRWLTPVNTPWLRGWGLATPAGWIPPWDGAGAGAGASGRVPGVAAGAAAGTTPVVTLVPVGVATLVMFAVCVVNGGG